MRFRGRTLSARREHKGGSRSSEDPPRIQHEDNHKRMKTSIFTTKKDVPTNFCHFTLRLNCLQSGARSEKERRKIKQQAIKG